MSASLEGRIDIELTPRGGAVNDVAIRSSRPHLAQRLMAGSTAQVAAERAGLMFSLCGKAQRVAAETACEAAQGIQPDVLVHAAREQRVLIELAQEHAWHLLLNWPRQTAIPPDMASLLALRQASALIAGAADPTRFIETLEGLLRDVFLGEPAPDWLARDLAAFDAWRRQAATLPAKLFGAWTQAMDHGISHAPLLPALHRLEAAQCMELARQALANEGFCARPEWAGKPAETGAIARMHEHPMLAAWIARRGRGAGARLLARLLELADMPRRLRDGGSAVVKAFPLAENVGMAAIETSRGLLIHALRLAQGRVADYRIVAPTEWNFHPAGPLAQALVRLPAGDDAQVRAQAICQSLDPCVAFDVEYKHA
ncbi:MAG: hypothetical protein B7Y41_13225 [Hydrogenophilales bacterium 28-61-23]|nr:MAG: hypothetical protein B7Y41_13225 [Hydrogenophilales bacterium 28-61-23]